MLSLRFSFSRGLSSLAFCFCFALGFFLRAGAWRAGRGTSNDRRECERAPRDARGGNQTARRSRTMCVAPGGGHGGARSGPLTHNAALCEGPAFKRATRAPAFCIMPRYVPWPRLTSPARGAGGDPCRTSFCAALTARALCGPRCVCTPRDGSEGPGARRAQRGRHKARASDSTSNTLAARIRGRRSLRSGCHTLSAASFAS